LDDRDAVFGRLLLVGDLEQIGLGLVARLRGDGRRGGLDGDLLSGRGAVRPRADALAHPERHDLVDEVLLSLGVKAPAHPGHIPRAERGVAFGEVQPDDGIDTFVEFGPGRVLAGLVRRIRKDARVLSVPDNAGLDAALVALGS